MEHEPTPYEQVQDNYRSKQTIKPDMQEPYELINIVGIAAVTTLLLTIIGIIVSFK